jgi:hypothetical protein
MNPMQARWYAEMVAKDKKEDFEIKRNLVEYLASFDHYEAINKIKSARDRAEDHAFMSDETFEDSIKDGSFKTNPLLDTLRAAKNTANSTDNIVGRSRDRSKKPLDLESIAGLIKKG